MNNYSIFLKKGKCSHCKNNLVFERKYSGEHLCPICFVKNIEKIIYKTISKYKMLSPRDNIVSALSGGKDSITLLYNLNKIQKKKYSSESLTALIIDEGIKDYRENSIKKAVEFCKQNEIEYHVVSFREKVGLTLDEIIKIKKYRKDYKNACNYCATIRRRLLNDGAKELGGNVLALGHNITDFAETFLMNVLYKRLPLIANQYLFKNYENVNKYYIKKINPLMRIPEEEIFLYANIKEFEYYSSHCPYREKDPILRKRVLNFIQKCKKYSPEIEFNLLNGFLDLSKILYEQCIQTDYYYCQNCGYPCGKSNYCNFCTYLNEFNH